MKDRKRRPKQSNMSFTAENCFLHWEIRMMEKLPSKVFFKAITKAIINAVISALQKICNYLESAKFNTGNLVSWINQKIDRTCVILNDIYIQGTMITI